MRGSTRSGKSEWSEKPDSDAIVHTLSAATSAEIMQLRRKKSVYTAPAEQPAAEGASGTDATVMQRLKDLDAKADQSLEFLDKLSTMVSESATRLEQMQLGGGSGGGFRYGSFNGMRQANKFPRLTASHSDLQLLAKTKNSHSQMDLQVLTNKKNSFNIRVSDRTARSNSRASGLSRSNSPAGGVDRRRNTDSVSSVNSLVSGPSQGHSYHTQLSLAPEMIANVFKRKKVRSNWALKIWNNMNENIKYVRLIRAVVLVSVLVSLMHTADEAVLSRPISIGLSVADVFFDVIFLIEISTRFFTCPSRIAFCYDPFNLLDVVGSLVPLVCRAIAGFSIPAEGGRAFSMRTFLLCGVPILRICKLLRSFSTFYLLLKAFRLAFEALPVLLFTLSTLVLLFSTLIYMAEPRSNIESYPHALWMTIITISTVGYGDAVPETVTGSMLVSCLIICGALYMAIPIGIVGNSFSHVWQDRDRLLLTKRARDRLIMTGYSASDVPMLFHAFDKDNDGHLNLPEFTRMITSMELGIDDERILDLFKLFDPCPIQGINDECFVFNLFPESYGRIYAPVSKPGKSPSVDFLETPWEADEQGEAGDPELPPTAEEFSATTMSV